MPSKRPTELDSATSLVDTDIFIVSANTTGVPVSQKATMKLIRDAVGKGMVATSTTRPSSPYVGQMIYETDTKRVTVFEGASWFDVASIPTGAIMMWGLATAPAGWLLLNGQTVSRTTYANLFSLWGVMYGVGDGSTTFRLPDLTGRVPVGYDAVQGEFNAVGKVGGAKTHQLVTSEMPAHTHTGPNHTHAGDYHIHAVDANTNLDGAHNHTVVLHGTTSTTHAHDSANGSIAQGGVTSWVTGTNGAVSGGGHSHEIHVNTGGPAAGGGATGAGGTGPTGSTGSNGAHNNLQPYFTLSFVVKT